MLQSIGLNGYLFYTYLLYISHKSGQPQTQLRNVGYQHQHDKDSQEIPQKLPEYSFNLHLSYLNAYKQGSSHRRGDGSDTQVENHHDTEMDSIHTKSRTHRKENRCKNKAGRSHIHKGTND